MKYIQPHIIIVPIIEECWVVLNALQDSINRGSMGTNVADLNNLDDVDFTKLSDVGSDMDIGDFDWSDINKMVKNRDGIHMKTTQEADTFVGKRVDGKKKGEGTLTLANGDKYVGEWDNDLKNGQGIFTYGNSDSSYVGEFKDGKRHGQGTYTLASGASYIGDWKDGEMNGQGTLNLLNGDKYTGEFKDSKFNGQGTITEANGDSYVIECKDSEQLGQGTSAKDDLHIDDFDWSDINKHGEEHPEHLYEEYEIDQIQEWMRGCLDGVSQDHEYQSHLVGQVSLAALVDELEWVTQFTYLLGGEFDSWLAMGPHRNRQLQLSPIHLMGAGLNHPEHTTVYRQDYYATWLPEIGITVISAYSGDLYLNPTAMGFIDGPYSVSKANNIILMLCSLWRCWTDDNISRCEFYYDDEDSPYGTECLFNNDLVGEYLLNETKA